MAVAVHNIPEGMCVAMPVYYATGSRWKGFWWSFVSGISEPIGGVFAMALDEAAFPRKLIKPKVVIPER